MYGIELGENFLSVRDGLHDVAGRGKWVNGPVHVLIEFGIIRDETHADSIWFWDEERGTDPSRGDIDLCDHILADKVLDDYVRLGLVS